MQHTRFGAQSGSEVFEKIVSMINDFKQYFVDNKQPVYENPSPGNDAVSSTALAAGGAQIILFTTGRGTPLGFPVPTIKISTNTDLYRRKKHWMDFDAGMMLQHSCPDELLESLLYLVLDVASGEKQLCNEINDCREIAIWKQGVTL